MIYVDPLLNRGWGYHGFHISSSHLFTDGDIEELHQFAAKIGLKRSWFQDCSIAHYDLTPTKRKVAVENGAKEVSRKEAVQLWREFREKLKIE